LLNEQTAAYRDKLLLLWLPTCLGLYTHYCIVHYVTLHRRIDVVQFAVIFPAATSQIAETANYLRQP